MDRIFVPVIAIPGFQHPGENIADLPDFSYMQMVA
jgi:hypothetical protein